MRAEGAISFRPVGHTDLALIEQWMREPHWKEWWGEADTELGYIRQMVEGRDSTRPFIFMIDGKDLGYIQYWFVGDHQNATWLEENPWLAALPPETIGVDLSIGPAAMLSKGLGTRVLKSFVEHLQTEGFREIIIDPDPKNQRAVRAYEKAGFRAIPELLGKSGDSLIMQYKF
jgi:Acetyltransferases, including N-acetylases of ribosomal proteins